MERIHAIERGCCEASWETEGVKEVRGCRKVEGGEEEVSRDTIEVFTYT